MTTTQEKADLLTEQINFLNTAAQTISNTVEELSKLVLQLHYEEENLPFDEPDAHTVGQTEFKIEVKTEHSFDELKNLITDKIHEGKREQVRDMLLWYGVHKLSELDPSKYDEVYEKGTKL